MEYVFFFALNYVLCLIIVLLDKKKFQNYVLLWTIVLILSLIFENATTSMGLWYYHVEPKVPFVSVATWLLYVPYISFCYFIAHRVINYF
jgi:hypothetical protein